MKSAVSYEINSTTSKCVYVFSLVACIIVLVDTVQLCITHKHQLCWALPMYDDIYMCM